MFVSPSSSFVIIYKLSSKLDSWQEIEVIGSKRQYTIQDLIPWISYDVRVILKGSSGLQSSSNVMPYLVTDTGKFLLLSIILYEYFIKLLINRQYV